MILPKHVARLDTESTKVEWVSFNAFHEEWVSFNAFCSHERRPHEKVVTQTAPPSTLAHMGIDDTCGDDFVFADTHACSNGSRLWATGESRGRCKICNDGKICKITRGIYVSLEVDTLNVDC